MLNIDYQHTGRLICIFLDYSCSFIYHDTGSCSLFLGEMSRSNNSLLDVQKSKPGLTTVWLLSTLTTAQAERTDNRSKKVCKKEIVTLSIPDTCNIIDTNTKFFPLRQISNLVYGVSLCYRRKAEYVLEDLNVVLVQLQKIHYYSSQVSNSTKASLKSKEGLTSGDSVGYGMLNSKHFLMIDDPTFNINEIGAFDVFLDNAIQQSNFIKDSLTIKKKDLLNEVRNANSIDLSNYGHSKYTRGTTLEEIPIDLDFNLAIGEIMSSHDDKQEDTLHIKKLNSELSFNSQRERHIKDFSTTTKSVQEEIGSLDLGIQELQNTETDEVPSHESLVNIASFKRAKRKREGTDENCYFLRKIEKDERTSLFTEALRKNHESYLDIMVAQEKHQKKLERKTDWKHDINLETNSKILSKCWNFIASKKFKSYTNDSIRPALLEQGRHHNADNDHTFSGSIKSSELGRKFDILPFESGIFVNNELPDSLANSNILLNLEQIDEELEEGYNFNPDSHENNNFMSMHLNLPSSSYGRDLSRTGTFNKSQTDIVDILEWNHTNVGKGSNNVTVPEIETPDDITDTNKNSYSYTNLLDHQAKKFYDFIVSKINDWEKENISVSDDNSIKFNSIVPDKVVSEETQEEYNMSKRVAAGAFLSLLNLASKGMIHLSQDSENSSFSSNDFFIYI